MHPLIRRIMRVLAVLLLAAVYFAAAKLGLQLGFHNKSVTAVWPPTGISLAVLLLCGLWLWPGIFLGAFAANYTVTPGVLTCLGIAAGNTLEAVLGAILVGGLAAGAKAFERPLDIFKFVFLAALLSTMVSATTGATMIALNGHAPWEDYGMVWLTWWLGDMVSDLTFAPLLVIWLSGWPPRLRLREAVEGIGMLACVAAMSYAVFIGGLAQAHASYPMEYLVIPLLLWAAFRFDPRAAILATSVMAAIALRGTLRNAGPFVTSDPNRSLMLLQAFVGIITITVMVFATAIAERKKVEEERVRLLDSERAARAEAERANRLKDEFLATVSHELRTPLNAILGWAQLLRSGSPPESERDYGITTIERNARVQAKLIEDLLDMSRIISGTIRLETAPVDFAAIVRSAIASIAPVAEQKNIQLSCKAAACPPLAGDALRLQQIVLNLLSNAVKFTPADGSIAVDVREVGSSIRLSVSDSGEGIAPSFLPFVFDRFRQAEGATTRKHGGMGLGLSIVKHLVELHHGSVDAQSVGEGHGATFTVTLPISAAAADAIGRADISHKAPAPKTLAGVRVLVVDDESDARELLRRVCISAGAEVTTAASAAEAAQMIQGDCPDVLLSDIGMPEEDGYGLIRRLRKHADARLRAIPAIALTAYARSEDRDMALSCGFQSHVAKPIDAAELAATITQVLRNRSGELLNRPLGG